MSHRARDALGNEDTVTLGEVPGGTGIAPLAVLAAIAGLLVLHGVDTAHTTVSLDELTLPRDEGGARGLGGTGEETTHHDGGGTKGETLDDVTDVLDTTVGDAGNTVLSGEAADGVDGRGLGTANGHDFLGNTGRATSHANSQTVYTSLDQGGRLFSGDDVSSDDLKLGELLLDPLDHFNLVHAVSLGAVKDDDVETSVDELLKPDFVLGSGADSGGSDELLAIGGLGGEGEILVLVQVGAGDHGNKVEVLVHDGELALLRVLQDLVGLGQGDAGLGSNEVGNHDIFNGLIEVGFELDITVSDDSEKLGTNATSL